MESVLAQVKNKAGQPPKPGADWLAENKNKVSELQTKLNYAYKDLQKLKDERDQLLNISNQLRADLNRAKRDLNEMRRVYGSMDNRPSAPGGMTRMESVQMFGLNQSGLDSESAAHATVPREYV